MAAVAGSVLSALPVFLVAALAPQIRASLHFGVNIFGAVIALYYLTAALGSLPLSRLVEAVGATRALRGGSLITAVRFLLLAILARGVMSLAVLVALAGLVSAAIQSATNLFLIRRIPADRQGLAFGLKQAAVPSAVVLSCASMPCAAHQAGRSRKLAALRATQISGCFFPFLAVLLGASAKGLDTGQTKRKHSRDRSPI